MLTLSIIKADTGGFVGHSSMHPEMLDVARRAVERVVGDLLVDAQVASCGDDLHLVMTHEHGVEAEPIHAFALPAVAERMHERWAPLSDEAPAVRHG